jgi:hypothetical protein
VECPDGHKIFFKEKGKPLSYYLEEIRSHLKVRSPLPVPKKWGVLVKRKNLKDTKPWKGFSEIAVSETTSAAKKWEALVSDAPSIALPHLERGTMVLYDSFDTRKEAEAKERRLRDIMFWQYGRKYPNKPPTVLTEVVSKEELLLHNPGLFTEE